MMETDDLLKHAKSLAKEMRGYGADRSANAFYFLRQNVPSLITSLVAIIEKTHMPKEPDNLKTDVGQMTTRKNTYSE